MEDVDSGYSSILDYNVCLYTDGVKMFKKKYNINKEKFISSYKKIISEFYIDIDTGINTKYVVVHLLNIGLINLNVLANSSFILYK